MSPDPKLAFGLLRMGQAYFESQDVELAVQVFYDVDEALDWLGGDPG